MPKFRKFNTKSELARWLLEAIYQLLRDQDRAKGWVVLIPAFMKRRDHVDFFLTK